MVKQRTPNSQDERSSRSAYDIIGQSASGDATWFGTKHSTEVRVLSARLLYAYIADVVNVADWKSDDESSILSVGTFRNNRFVRELS